MSSEIVKLGDVIENIGLGLTHVRFVLTGGGIWFADGLELTIISIVAKSAAIDFNVGPLARGFLVTVVYFGVACGNAISGPLGDRYGRRYLILISYMGIFIFSVASSVAPSYFWLALIRVFVGASFGFGQPVWNALVAEISPSFWLPVTNAVSQSLFTFGEIYCYWIVWLDNPSMMYLNWRLLLQEGAFPSIVFFIVALIWLLEAPGFLAKSGKYHEAKEVLTTMACDNGKPDMSVSFDYPQVDVVDQAVNSHRSELSVVFSRQWLGTTVIMMYSCFVMNFIYYGSLYAFPQILPDVTTSNTSPAIALMIGACWEFLGYAIAAVASLMYPRKPTMKGYLVLTGLSVCLFAGGILISRTGIGDVMRHIGFYGTKCFVTVGYVVVYVYVSEVYPAEVKVTGTAVAFTCGRVGAMLASISYEVLTELSHSYSTFFVVCAVFCFSNLCFIYLLPHETYNNGMFWGKGYGTMHSDTPSVSEAVTSKA
mmetsp:Transcript_110301/g.172474  ORF Transcript_110301/g.172474 Transcript_110301/m.172474 type:complete len:482 (-) Transcript_110301:29-1474(-)